MKRRKPETRPEPQESARDLHRQYALAMLKLAMKFAAQAMNEHPGNKLEQVTSLISRIKEVPAPAHDTHIKMLEIATLCLECETSADVTADGNTSSA